MYDVKMALIIQRLQELGLQLPVAPTPIANYVPAIICGNELRTSGQIPMQDGQLMYRGPVPNCQSVEQATSAAQLCGLNAIAVAGAALDGDFDRISGVLQLRIFVASDAEFEGHSTVANGASDLMVAIFGEMVGTLAFAMGSIGLPLGATVEVEAAFSISE